MVFKKYITYLLFVFVVTSTIFIFVKEGTTNTQNPQNNKVEKNDKIVVFYFHGNARCYSCLRIESFSKMAIEQGFKKKIDKGIIEWRVINVDSSVNRHYIEDYKLYTKSLVFSLVKKGVQEKWKNLEKVWAFLGDKKAFFSYVQYEMETYLGEIKR